MSCEHELPPVLGDDNVDALYVGIVKDQGKVGSPFFTVGGTGPVGSHDGRIAVGFGGGCPGCHIRNRGNHQLTLFTGISEQGKQNEINVSDQA